MTFLWNFLSFMVLGWIIGLVAHEAGHWAVGTLLGIPIRVVTIGRGPILWQRQIGMTRVELRRVPNGGHVLPYPILRAGPGAFILFVMGGVLGNVAVIALVALITAGSDTELAGTLMPGVVGAQAYFIVMNLIPRRARKDSAIASDGYQIFWTLFHYRAAKAHGAAMAARYATMLAPYRRSDRPPAPTAIAARISCAIDRMPSAEDRPEAARDLLHELEEGSLAPDEEMLVLDALVTNQLIYGDLGLEARLDELSARAQHLGPDVATLRGTRGAVLVERGRHAEGRVLLTPLTSGPPSLDTIISHLFLARAAHELGAAAEANRRLEAARATIGATSYAGAQVLLDRIAAEIGVVSDPNVSHTQRAAL